MIMVVHPVHVLSPSEAHQAQDAVLGFIHSAFLGPEHAQNVSSLEGSRLTTIFYSTPIAPYAQLRPGHYAPQPISTPSRCPHLRQGTRSRGRQPPRAPV